MGDPNDAVVCGDKRILCGIATGPKRFQIYYNLSVFLWLSSLPPPPPPPPPHTHTQIDHMNLWNKHVLHTELLHLFTHKQTNWPAYAVQMSRCTRHIATHVEQKQEQVHQHTLPIHKSMCNNILYIVYWYRTCANDMTQHLDGAMAY